MKPREKALKKIQKEGSVLLKLRRYYEREDRIHQLQPNEEKLLKAIKDVLNSYKKFIKEVKK